MASVLTGVLTRVVGGASRQRYFSIFLRDHMVAAVAGLELARRTRGENKEGELGAFLATLVTKLESERGTLRDLARRVEIEPSSIGEAGGWLAEKAARIKLNGQLFGYSPLSRVAELEALMVFAQQRLAFWRILERHSRVEKRLEGIPFSAHLESADEDRRLLERYLMEAADKTF